MKRSEFVDKIAPELSNYIMLNYDELDNDIKITIKNITSFLLRKFEDNGMLPPPLQKIKYNTVREEIDCRWEPEDE